MSPPSTSPREASCGSSDTYQSSVTAGRKSFYRSVGDGDRQIYARHARGPDTERRAPRHFAAAHWTSVDELYNSLSERLSTAMQEGDEHESETRVSLGCTRVSLWLRQIVFKAAPSRRT